MHSCFLNIIIHHFNWKLLTCIKSFTNNRPFQHHYFSNRDQKRDAQEKLWIFIIICSNLQFMPMIYRLQAWDENTQTCFNQARVEALKVLSMGRVVFGYGRVKVLNILEYANPNLIHFINVPDSPISNSIYLLKWLSDPIHNLFSKIVVSK